MLSGRRARIHPEAAYNPRVPHSRYILIGPFSSFGLIKDTEMLNNFSDLAIVLLLFGVGLSFPLKQLGAIGRIGSSIAGIEVLVMLELALQLEALMDDHFMMQCSWQLRSRQAPLP